MQCSLDKAPTLLRISNMLGLVGASAGFAMLLKTKRGHQLAGQHPGMVIIFGVVLTLLYLAFEDPRAAGKAFLYFFISSILPVTRALRDQIDDDEMEVEWVED